MHRNRPISRRELLKATAGLAGVLGVGALTACSAPAAPATTSAPAATQAAAATQAPAVTKFKDAAIKVGHLNTADHPVNLGIIKFKEIIEAKTNGTVKVSIFPAGQLAPNENELIQGVRLGTTTMCLTSAGGLGVFVADYMVMAVPYIWRDMEHIKKVTRGEIGASLSDQSVQKLGVRVLDGARLYGDRFLTTKNKLIKTPDDLKGMKIRVPEVPIYLETIRALGASPVAVSTAEIYTALATGVADGQENPATSIYTWKLYEVQKYLMKSRHITQNNLLTINEDFWKGLDPALQTAIRDAVWESGDYETQMAVKMNDEAVANLKSKGMEINEVDLDAFKKACAGVPDKFADKWTPGLVEKIRAA